MSVSDTVTEARLTPNGVAYEIDCPGLIASSEDEITVRQFDGEGEEVTIPGYTIAGLGDAAGITITNDDNEPWTADPDGVVLVQRNSDMLQQAEPQDFRSMGDEELAAVFDKPIKGLQEVKRGIARALRLSDAEGGELDPIPVASLRANMALMFDALGRLVVGSPLTAGVLVVSAWVQNNLLNVASATAGRAALLAMGTAADNSPTGVNDFTGGRVKVPTRPGADDGTDAANTEWVNDRIAASLALVRSYLAGLTMSTAGGSTTMAIAAGVAADSANVAMIALAAAINKTTGAWAVGSGNGGRLTAVAVANNTWYTFFLIRNPTSGVVDVAFQVEVAGVVTDPTANLPAGYTQFRRIGSGLTNGSAQWVAFTQNGDDFDLLDGVLDVDTTNPGTAAVLATLSVPRGVKVQARINVLPTFGSNSTPVYLSDPAVTNAAPSRTVAPLATTAGVSSSAAETGGWSGHVRTDTSARIRYRLAASGGADIIRIATLGWRDRRGRDD